MSHDHSLPISPVAHKHSSLFFCYQTAWFTTTAVISGVSFNSVSDSSYWQTVALFLRVWRNQKSSSIGFISKTTRRLTSIVKITAILLILDSLVSALTFPAIGALVPADRAQAHSNHT
jgi:hypothetical protein